MVGDRGHFCNRFQASVFIDLQAVGLRLSTSQHRDCARKTKAVLLLGRFKLSDSLCCLCKGGYAVPFNFRLPEQALHQPYMPEF